MKMKHVTFSDRDVIPVGRRKYFYVIAPGPRKRRRKRPETYENGGKRLPFTITFTMHRKTAK